MKKYGVALLLILLALFFISCDDDTAPPKEDYSDYCVLEPFEGNYAQVTFKTSKMVYPTVCQIKGKNYTVAVINGFENPEDARNLTGTLEIKDGIRAINSNAFAHAENIEKIILPPSCQSLGTNSLPPNPSEIILDPEAAKDLSRAIQDKDSLKTITLVGTSITNITGNFTSLEKVQIVGEYATAQVFWPTIPSLPNPDGQYFSGWYDSLENRVLGGSKVEKLNTVITINAKEYYLYGVATPKFSEEPPEEPIEDPQEPTSSNSGFKIPCFLISTEEKYGFEFTDYGNGVFGIKPKTCDLDYSLRFNSNKVDWKLDDSGQWRITLDRLGTYTFSCFYQDKTTGKNLGYGQITFTYNN